VTIQTESAKQVDKLRRKEEKRNKRGTENGGTDELAVADSFISLLLASERKQPFDDVIGTGERNSLSITALPKGTSRSNYPGYEEVKIPAIPTSAMGPNEKLVMMVFMI
jgi:activating signal cointegrator complex subunit 3